MKANFAALAAGIILAAGIAGCAGPTEEQKAAAAAAKPLSGPELTQLVTSNGMTGLSQSKKSNWTEYYDASGAIVGAWKSIKSSDTGKYSGSWKIEGDKFCGDYKEVPDANGCWGVAVNGDRVYFLGDDGMARNPDRPATVITGKPEGL